MAMGRYLLSSFSTIQNVLRRVIVCQKLKGTMSGGYMQVYIPLLKGTMSGGNMQVYIPLLKGTIVTNPGGRVD